MSLDWNSAPKDGAAINVHFEKGRTAVARWNAAANPEPRWEVQWRDGNWIGMEYDCGGAPLSWSPRPLHDQGNRT